MTTGSTRATYPLQINIGVGRVASNEQTIEMPVLRWQQTTNEIFQAALLEAASQPAHVDRGDIVAAAVSMTAATILRAVMRHPEWALGLLMEAGENPAQLDAWLNAKADGLAAAIPVTVLNRPNRSS